MDATTERAGPFPSAPPSASAALVWTVLAAMWLWFLLPVAVIYCRRARREAEASNGVYAWSSSHLLHRPVLFWFVAFGAQLALVAVMVAVGMFGGTP